MKAPWTLSGAPSPKVRPTWVPQSFGVCRQCGRDRRAVHRCPWSPAIRARIEAFIAGQPTRLKYAATPSTLSHKVENMRVQGC